MSPGRLELEAAKPAPTEVNPTMRVAPRHSGTARSGTVWPHTAPHGHAPVTTPRCDPARGGADKPRSVAIAGALQHMGFTLYATGGTARFLQERGIDTQTVFKVREGRPDVDDLIKNGQIQLIVNTPLGKKSQYDELAMRLAGLEHGVPCITTLSVGKALIEAIRSRKAGELKAIKLQEIV